MKHDLSPIQYQTPSILHPNKRAKEQKQLSKANKENNTYFNVSKLLNTKTHFLELCFYFSRHFWFKSYHTFFYLFRKIFFKWILAGVIKGKKKRVFYMLVFCERFSLCSWSERKILNNPGFIRKGRKKKKKKSLELSVWLYIQICERKEKHMAMTERPQSRTLKEISMKNKVPITKWWFTV